ncbi:trehalose operon repressor [Clostridium tagluense]|uniref:trehalose operon repressor n=1 Tax=Clostridium tagluense TaxID=360422 RepID=UPI001C0B49C1|nr:trehalose operon repressor [Clostridium tagluense]MBU3128357.1 trehalose operon repressor [Clostridium tagluense]MBW9157586.1 trehalose operon repressor [Clostridium tagluense]MCB2313820.1 trehalose operon repressor [Clostridium tagluense]MCB2318630.1 trehalose operon repressor [Clostridium tagluense]MCB2323505.1 trehalose operon repressor [Clostridium tagluense]
MKKLYTDIYDNIKKNIVKGIYTPGEKLPSENDFCKEFGASRGTVRKALEMLAEEGLVNSLHGKGVFVLENDFINFSFGGLVSFKEASESSKQKFSTTVPKFEEVIIDEAISKKSNLAIGKEAYKLYRVRSLEDEKIIFDINYFLKDIVQGLTVEIGEKSIYEYIEESLNVKIGFASKVIQVETATSRDKLNLDMKSYNFVVVVKNYVYLSDGTQFEYTESRHRPDRFVFSDFARRR